MYIGRHKEFPRWHFERLHPVAALIKGLLAQLVECYTGIAEVMGSNPLQAWIFFFRPYFHFCTSSVHYCEDCLHIHIFICSSNIWLSYIYSHLLSTQLIIPNYLVILSHWCSTIVSLEVYLCFLMAFTAWINCVGENIDVFCYSPFPPKKMFYFYIWLVDKVAQVG